MLLNKKDNNKKWYILEFIILTICIYIGNKLGGFFLFLPLIEFIVFMIIKENLSIKEAHQRKDICKVCGKEIVYNEYGTCEACHKKILKRLEKRNI